MVRAWVIWVILGCALVTVIPRVAPLVFLSRVRMPGVLERWLGYVPVAVLAALFAQSVAMPAGRLDLTPGNPALLAAAPVLLVALLTLGVGAALLFNPFAWPLIFLQFAGVAALLCGVALAVFPVAMLGPGTNK